MSEQQLETQQLITRALDRIEYLIRETQLTYEDTRTNYFEGYVIFQAQKRVRQGDDPNGQDLQKLWRRALELKKQIEAWRRVKMKLEELRDSPADSEFCQDLESVWQQFP